MSGICGAWALDGGAAPALDPILSKLERRGPDGTRAWSEGPVALGHTLLATTPEAQVEQLPLTEPDSGCTITADARLDNREELIPALGLSGETRIIGDGELILRAYLEWGEGCPIHLLGDFAFAIWDPSAQRLFCARDHMGMRQFNYCHVPDKVFVLGTEDTAVLAQKDVPQTLNEGRIADFIIDLEGYDFTSTFFQNIHRLPPAHALTVDQSGSNLRRYWQLRPPPLLKLNSDHAYSDAFMAVFIQAVACRLRNAGTIGAMLSGGLDSSSIVAVAARLLSAANEGPLTTFSAVSTNSGCPETNAIASAMAIDGLRPILIDPLASNGTADELIAAMDDVRNPFEVNASMLRGIYLTAKKNGVNIILDGGAGDVVLTSGNRLAAALALGNISNAFREIVGETRYWKPVNPVRFIAYQFFSAAWVAFMPRRIRALRRKRQLSKPVRAMATDFARRVGITQRRLTADKHVSANVVEEADRRAQSISHPNLPSGRERFDQLSSMFAVECRDPFMDIRLIEFCLSLPPEQLQANGWRKLILRRSIDLLVPRNIAWRLGKEHLGWDYTSALLESWPEWSASMRMPDSPLHDYLSVEAITDLQVTSNSEPTALDLRLFALDRFLRRYRIEDCGH